MHFLILSVALAAQLAFGAVNEPCYGAGGAAGVCVTTAACSAKGGTTVNNACPRDPDNVKCCTKPDCGAGDRNCRWTSDCAGSTFANQCPGPSGFKCCSSNARGWGGYSAPRIPTTGDGCKAVAINGARKIVAQFPGRVRDIGCKRSCSAGSTSDHCDGKATDMMCSDKTETASISGREIAEWIMRNRATLNLKYVIWGQRIWERQHSVKPWTEWETMEDRNNVRENHWDHVHVSYN